MNTSSKQEVQGLMVDINFKHGSARDGLLRCPPRDQYRPLDHLGLSFPLTFSLGRMESCRNRTQGPGLGGECLMFAGLWGFQPSSGVLALP